MPAVVELEDLKMTLLVAFIFALIKGQLSDRLGMRDWYIIEVLLSVVWSKLLTFEKIQVFKIQGLQKNLTILENWSP